MQNAFRIIYLNEMQKFLVTSDPFVNQLQSDCLETVQRTLYFLWKPIRVDEVKIKSNQVVVTRYKSL